MMKNFYILLIGFLKCGVLLSHGFGADTFVLLANNSLQCISTICYRAQTKKVFVASYNTASSFQTTAQVIRGGHSQTNCYIQFGFEESFEGVQHQYDIVCRPTQEFYNALTHKWVPAYMLKIGDTLLCANDATKTVAYISLSKKSLPIFTIQVQDTHTFFVTQYSVLTHNMVIPLAFNVGLGIPFSGAAGGTVGSFFGPATFAVGTAIGCIVGILTKMVCAGNIPTYAVETYNAHMFEYHVKQQPQITVSEPLCRIATQSPTQTKIDCGDTTPQKPLIVITPAELIPIYQNPGYKSLSDEERKMLSSNCTLTPIPVSERESPIGCQGIVPVAVDAFNFVTTMGADDSHNERYNGPIYNRTEDWIKNHPLPDNAKEAFERTNLGMQGKRAYRLKKKIPTFTGIFQDEHVVIDALHKDHLEVYNKHGDWIRVANFDGTKNVDKTNQGSKGNDRLPLKEL